MKTPCANLTVMQHRDLLDHERTDVLALAGLIEEVGDADLDDAAIDATTLLAGFAAIARVVRQKLEAIETHTDALFRATEQNARKAPST